MKSHAVFAGSAAFGLAVLVSVPTELEAFSKLGFSLDLDNRSVRIFNNFQDPSANDNQTPDAQFPGFQGAAMAVWKASVEWGSLAHGDGTGDPTQPQLGDGGANFDAAWLGDANAPGGRSDNIVSAIAGCAGGVLAFTTFSGGGWQIRFYECYEWDDGPGDVPNGRFDIQGVAAHMYGHALGLGHTSIAGATMFPAIVGTGVGLRSIEADDRAGVQCIYGVAAPNKPRIDQVTGSGTDIVIQGSFPTSGLEVWFTRSLPSAPADKLPLKLTGVVSNGSTIQVTMPAGAGAGDVLVRDGSSSSGAALSNAFPYDPCVQPSVYCTAKTTSIGSLPSVLWSGRPSHGAAELQLACAGAVPLKPGIYFSGSADAAIPFQGGFLCVAPPLKRSEPFVFDANGETVRDIAIALPDIGDTRYFQFWGRDTAAHGALLSDAGEVTFCP